VCVRACAVVGENTLHNQAREGSGGLQTSVPQSAPLKPPSQEHRPVSLSQQPWPEHLLGQARVPDETWAWSEEC
jgi:hypothetical protein